MSEILIQTLLQGLQNNPDDLGLLTSLGDAYRSLQNHEEALTTYQKAVAIDSSNTGIILKVIDLAKQLDKPELITAYQALLNANGVKSNSPNEVDDVKPPEENAFSRSNASDDSIKIDSPQVDQDDSVKRVRGQKLKLVSDHGTLNTDDIIEAEDSSIYLDDVGGMHQVKKRLNLTFLAPLKNPELVKKYGKKTSSGLILYGPPGCGKTFIARALAGEIGAKFFTVSLADILDMYIGESEKKLHEIFETARRNTPAILFFDELDAIGQKRSNLKNSGMRTLVNQLLNEMDSVEGNNEGLFILAATNLPWDIDSALKRPGRFDRVVPVFPPDQEAREHILRYHLRDTPFEDVDVEAIAKQTEQFSGADLAHLVQSAIEVVFEESLETGEARAVSNTDFEQPLKEVKPSTRQWFESARNYAMFANQSGAYDDLLEYIRNNKL
ncbi:AAA family ATPase [Aliikangiella marina]|uniref:AAA family ATPase n=1 Tax=Aliikangiella marina TaxID=1712262 RepID=A0A545TGU4_9GAMM|nr:AAA family ATPase [Aliikangiella marina]TQV76447.1 AAA family ATPase [Aliikangiella marina]